VVRSDPVRGRVVGEVLRHKAAAGGNADDESRIESGRAQGELPCRGDEFDLEPGVPVANASQGGGRRRCRSPAVAAGKLVEPLRALCKDLEVPGAYPSSPRRRQRVKERDGHDSQVRGDEMTSHA